MIELARHIEILLLENDCVIVPELGGFIAHYQPAHYVESENIYLPPMRTIGFNPQLTINDGLLAQSYMQAHHTDFPDATRMIAKEVEGLKDILYKEGCAEIDGIGKLYYTIHGTYEFHPYENGVLSPGLYILHSFVITQLREEHSVVAATKELIPQPSKRNREFHISRRWIGNAVAVAAAVILFFFLSVPVENTYVDKGNYASLGTDGLFEAIRSQSLATTVVVPAKPQQPQKKNLAQKNAQTGNKNLKPVAVKVEKVSAPKEAQVKEAPATSKQVSAAPKEEAKAEIPAKVAVKPAPAPAPAPSTVNTGKQKYFIIISSLATAKDAEETLNAYKQKGHKDVNIIEGNGRYRLSLCGFSDKAAAYKKLNELKQDEAFKNAWLLTSK
ncbi:HU domain-containing protein [Phocaeicola sp.]